MTQRLLEILVDSFWKILLPGFTITIPLTVVSFALAMVIATVTALIQFRKVPILTPLARFYIWIIRGTPLLVQLYVIFYGLPRLGLVINPIPAAIAVFPSTPALTTLRLSGPRWRPFLRGSWRPVCAPV